MSIYASGLDLEESSREPSTSPDLPPKGRQVPTFRQPTGTSGLADESSSSRNSKGKAGEAGTQSVMELGMSLGYLDPVLPLKKDKGKGRSKEKEGDVSTAKNKGKQKMRAGQKYLSVPEEETVEEDEGEEEDDRGRLAGFGIGKGKKQGKGKTKAPEKAGLNDYERALWRWVNVEDLDGFLQEVSCFVSFLSRVSS
jgi:hypothetical protein